MKTAKYSNYSKIKGALLKVFVSDVASTNRGSARDYLCGGGLALISLLVGLLLLGGRRFDLYQPVYYSTDGLVTLSMIKRLMDGFWVYGSDLLGFPLGGDMLDYPVPDTASLLALKVMGLSLGSPVAAYSLYFLIGFPLNAVASFAVLRYLRLSLGLSLAGGFIYTMVPFHFLRVGHLFYTWYFVAPLFTWLAFRVYGGTLDFFNGRQGQLRDVLIIFVLGCFGVYYALFGTISIAIAGLTRYLRDRTGVSIRGAAIACAIVVSSVVVNTSPTIVHSLVHGHNEGAVVRGRGESEIHGLKAVQLLLPREGHRSRALANLNAKYETQFPLVYENSTSSLGIIGSVGFIALLLVMFRPRNDRNDHDDRMTLLAYLNLGMFICCTIGGVSSVFALLVTPDIRGWNRGSIFIAFFCIAAAMAIADRHRWSRSAAGVAAVPLLLCAFALWDQTTPFCVACADGMRSAYKTDQEFTESVEHSLPKHAAIYQLPYMGFPETPPVNNMGDYVPLAGYINSHFLRWSYGGMKGREGDLFFRDLSAKPIAQQIPVVRKMGFSAIWVDRRGYADGGKAIEADLYSLLGEAPAIVSGDGSRALYRLSPTP